MSGRLIQPPKHDGRIGSQSLPPSPDHPREKGNAYLNDAADRAAEETDGRGGEKPHPIRDSFFHRCSAHKGGGGAGCRPSKPTFDGCTFEKCQTRHIHGGGLHIAESSPSVTECRFLRCSAGRLGGGIYADEGSVPRVVKTTFTDCVPGNSNVPVG